MRTFPITTGELAQKLDCKIIGHPDLVLNGAETIEGAGPDHLTFFANRRYRQYFSLCRAGAIILSDEDHNTEYTKNLHLAIVRLISNNPYEDFRRAVEILYGSEEHAITGISNRTEIDETAEIGADVAIGPFVQVQAGARIGAGSIIYPGAFIGRDAVLGDHCIIGVNVSLRHEVQLGHRVWVGDGSVIGYDGFGYVPATTGYKRIRPVGRVEIGDDVHIGANTCIDRATVGVTRIDKGSKLDNLIQIAHGVEIGSQTAIAAQAGISGSARIGSWVQIGGQAGFVGHIDVADGMQVGAQAGVTRSWDSHGLITGCPARPMIEMRKIDASMTKLPALTKQIKSLEQRLSELEEKLKSRT